MAGAETSSRTGKPDLIEKVQPRILDGLAVLSLTGLAFLLLSRQILFGGTVYNDDIVLQSIPAYDWFAEGLRRGEIPIWSPTILGGFPLAFAQYGFFYPPDILLFRLLDSDRAFHLSLALHLALAGTCTYCYCRILGLRPIPSLLAGVAFQMGNEVTSWPANGYITKTLFLLPALLATMELMLRKTFRYWLLVPWLVGGAFLVGYAQIVLFALCVAAAYALVAALVGLRSRPPAALRFLLLLVAGVALGLGLAAVRVFPTLAVTALSTRAGGMGLEQVMADSIEPWAIVAGYLFPVLFELPGKAVARPDYVGIPALFLAALWPLVGGRSGRVGRFFLGLGLVSVVLSLGSFTPAYGQLMQLPFFSYFHGPNRLSLVAAMAISVLAAYSLDGHAVATLVGNRLARRVILVAGMLGVLIGVVAVLLSIVMHFAGARVSAAVGVAAGQALGQLSLFRLRSALSVLGVAAVPILVMLYVRRVVGRTALEWGLLALTVLTLSGLGWVRYQWMPSAALRESPAVVAALQADSDLYRVLAWAPRLSTYNVGAYYQGVVGTPPSLEFNERYLRQFVPPNLSMLSHTATADGYEALPSRRQALAILYMGSERLDSTRFSDGTAVESRLYGLSLQDRLNLLAALNVKYLLHAFPIQDPRLEQVDEVAVRIYPNLDATAKVYLYRLKNAMPRAFVVPEAVSLSGERAVLDTLLAGSVDLQRQVILEEQPAALELPLLTSGGSGVEITEYQDDRVSLASRTDGSGFLILMDFLLPGWTATVDGRPEPVLAGNFAGRAVPLRGAGEHIVEFGYEAPLLREGLLASGVSLLVLVIGSAVSTIRRKRSSETWPTGPSPR